MAEDSCGRCSRTITNITNDETQMCSHCAGALCLECWEGDSFCLKPECQRHLADVLARAKLRAH